MQRQGRSSQKTIVLLGQKPGSNSRDVHNSVFELFTELKPPTDGRCQHFSFQRKPPKAKLSEPEKIIRRLPEIRLKEKRPCTHPYLISNPL